MGRYGAYLGTSFSFDVAARVALAQRTRHIRPRTHQRNRRLKREKCPRTAMARAAESHGVAKVYKRPPSASPLCATLRKAGYEPPGTAPPLGLYVRVGEVRHVTANQLGEKSFLPRRDGGNGLNMKEFPPFRLDIVNQCLWRSTDAAAHAQRIFLTPKAFAVLSYLVDHAGQLVTHRELLEAVWPNVVVQPEVISSHIRDLRIALGDKAKEAQFIETLSRRGYRFMAPVYEPASQVPLRPTPNRLVGRDQCLEELWRSMRAALDGQRQVVFVTGEPGIGKTSLVDEFARQALGELRTLRVATGQCIEGYGGKEAYNPVLKALGDLCRAGGEKVIQTFATYAPTSLIQFPTLLKREQREALQRETQGATGGRMLREIGDALEVLTQQAPLLIVFEDLHWTDYSTVDFISELARRRGPARLLLIGTYRPADLMISGHPLKRLVDDLQLHQLGREIALKPLSETDVVSYLSPSLPQAAVREELAALLHRHSDGNPLFMVSALDHMFERGLIRPEDGVWKLREPLADLDLQFPETVRRMVEAQIDQLSAEEQLTLEVASVAGTVFASEACAAAAEVETAVFEDSCEALARRHQIVRATNSQRFPNGTSSARYTFAHGLYRDVIYLRQAPSRRSKRERLIGERLENLWADQLAGVAAELAHHFEAGSDWIRTVRYLRLGAETAEHRFAHREAQDFLQHALTLTDRLDESTRTEVEIGILESLAAIYVASFDERCVETYQKLATKARQYGLPVTEIRAYVDLVYCLSWVSSERCLQVADQAYELGNGLSDEVLRARVGISCLFWRIWAGEWKQHDADEARRLFARIRSTLDRKLLAPYLIDYGLLQWASSEYREAHECVMEGLTDLAEPNGDNPYLSITYQRSQAYIPRSRLFLGDWGEALREIETEVATADKNGDYFPAQLLRLNRAWIHLNAMDFSAVLTTCNSLRPVSEHFASTYLLRFRLILAGCAEAGSGNHDRALEMLSNAREDMKKQKIIMDWYFRLLIQSAIAEIYFAKGDMLQARQEAEEFLEIALHTAERTWQALAWEVNARIADAQRNALRRSECVERALSIVNNGDLPLANWRVHRTAAAFYTGLASRELAREHYGACKAGIFRLADSLQPEDPLRVTFLSSSAVAEVLGHCKG